jgi:transcription initiation factor TFIID TATA-box-binding protein
MMTVTTPIIAIVNVVASAAIDEKLDLIKIQKKIPEIEYNPDLFPGAVFRLKTPKTATLLFSTGKMVCTGSKSEDLAREAVKLVVQRLRKEGIKIKKDAVVTVQNIVSSINLGGKIHLEKTARTLPGSMYEPEQFPGVIHRMVDPKTVVLLFASGKLVCVGAKTEKDVFRSVNNLHSRLEELDLMLYD